MLCKLQSLFDSGCQRQRYAYVALKEISFIDIFIASSQIQSAYPFLYPFLTEVCFILILFLIYILLLGLVLKRYYTILFNLFLDCTIESLINLRWERTI